MLMTESVMVQSLMTAVECMLMTESVMSNQSEQ